MKVEVDAPVYSILLENALQNTVVYALTEIQKEAKIKAPVDTGYYRNSINIEFETNSVVANAEYSAPIEYGIQNPVIILPKTAKALHFVVDGVDVFTKRVQQSPRQPNPVMRTSALDVQNKITDTFLRNFNNV